MSISLILKCLLVFATTKTNGSETTKTNSSKTIKTNDRKDV